MNIKWLDRVYFWIRLFGFMAALSFFCLRADSLEAAGVTPQDLKEVLPKGDVFVPRQNTWPYYEAYQTNQQTNELIGLCFLSTELFPEERGYNGPIKILVGLDLKGTITGIKILEHSETPAYVRAMYEPQFRRQFMGKTIWDPFEAGRDIDGISGATITTGSIVRSVRNGIRLLAEQILKIKGLPKEPGPFDEFKHPRIYIFLLIVLSAIKAYLSINRWLRYGVLLFSFIFLGLFKAHFLVLQNFVQLVQWHFPQLRGNLFWFFFFFAVLSATFIWGRIYCGYLCPFGALTEALRRIFSCREKEITINQTWHISARSFKYLIILAILFVFYLTQKKQTLNYEVYITLFTWQKAFWPWLFLGFVLLAALWQPYFWCQYLCPAGAMLGIISQISLVKLRLKCHQSPKDNYCRNCVKTCFMRAIEVKEQPLGPPLLKINQAECIRCNECRVSCPEHRKRDARTLLKD